MRGVFNTWAVVLAGGEGSRLREITTTKTGEVVPKQFCSLQGDTCLLQDAIERAGTVASPEHICSVVAERHRRWWTPVLDVVPLENIFVQPKNCGTAHGILLALLQIERRDPKSVVALLPADHYVADEATMAHSLRAATALAAHNKSLVYLLGAEPDHADEQLGYIVPSGRCRTGAAAVIRFVEKPSAEQARELMSDGALWNTFIFAGSLRALLALFERHFQSTMEAMRNALKPAETQPGGTAALEVLYEDLKSYDFSRDVLERREAHLQVLRLPSCGWTDLGTPERVEETVRGLGSARRSTSQLHSPSSLYFDLGRVAPVATAGALGLSPS